MIVGRDAQTFNCPKDGNQYFYLLDGKVKTANWEQSAEDFIRWKTGNCFPTEQNAYFKLNQDIVLTHLRQFIIANNEEISWKNRSSKYILCYKKNLDAIAVIPCVYETYGEFVFSSVEIAQKAIDEVGKDNLKIYLFNIKED